MLKVIFVLIGTFVGAGFASGKEIFNFFTLYQECSFFSIFLFTILLFLCIYKCFTIKSTFGLTSYQDFLEHLEEKHVLFKHHFFLWIIRIFLASSFYMMVSALSTLFLCQFHLAKWMTILACVLLCYPILFQKNIHFIYMINSILMPVLILFVFALCLKNIHFQNINFPTFMHGSQFFKSIVMGLLYFSYNSLLLIPIIFDLKFKHPFHQKINFQIAFWYAFIIFIMTFLLNTLLLGFYHAIDKIELPVLFISTKSGGLFPYFYFLVILSSIFTTMISSGYAFISNFHQNHFRFKLILFLLLSLIFSSFSFSSLINFFYPLFGWIGILQIFLIFTHTT